MTADNSPTPNDEIPPLLEPAEALVTAWTRALRDAPAGAHGDDCPPDDALRTWVAGAVSPAQSIPLVTHFASCTACRRFVRDERVLHYARGGGGAVDLAELRAVCTRRPENADHALARISMRIASLLSSVPSQRIMSSGRFSIGNERQEYTGHDLELDVVQPPRIDAVSRLRLDLRIGELTDAVYEVHITVRDSMGTIRLGSAPIIGEIAPMTIDVRELALSAGYLAPESVEIAVERKENTTLNRTSLLETGPLPASAAQRSVPTDAMSSHPRYERGGR